MVSCVEENPPFRVHPHKLMGKDCSDDGICRITVIPQNDMMYEFINLKLQCVRKERKTSNVTFVVLILD